MAVVQGLELLMVVGLIAAQLVVAWAKYLLLEVLLVSSKLAQTVVAVVFKSRIHAGTVMERDESLRPVRLRSRCQRVLTMAHAFDPKEMEKLVSWEVHPVTSMS